MNCKDFHLYASAYIDEALTEEEKRSFELHTKNCSQCQVAFENLKVVVESINEIEEIDLPENFTESFRSRLKEEKAPKDIKKPKSKHWKIAMGLVAGLMVVAVSSVMFNQSSLPFQQRRGGSVADTEMATMDNRGMDNEMRPFLMEDKAIGSDSYGMVERELIMEQSESEEEATSFATGDGVQNQQVTQRMRIQSGYLTLEVENIEGVYEQILQRIRESQGYVEQSNTSYYSIGPNEGDTRQQTHMTLRVPSQTFELIFQELKSMGKVTSQGFNEEDITDRYRDIEAEVANLEVQETRLRELFERAERVEDLMRLENELARIRLQINNLNRQLKSYDQRVNLATINLTLQEVGSQRMNIHSIDEGLGTRMINQLVGSTNRVIGFVEASLIGFVGLLPPLALISVIGGPIGIILIRRKKNKS